MFELRVSERYLVVLVGCYGSKGCLSEDVGAECCVFGAKAVVLVCFDNMETGLVFVHGVEDYLHNREQHRKTAKFTRHYKK